MSQLHTDDKFMYSFSILDELKRQTQSDWENELIDDFDDYDTVPRDYNRICIDDATPADWDALADKRLKARGVDSQQTENFDLRDEQEEALEEMVRQAEELDLYDDAIVHDLTKPLSQQIGGEHYRQGDIQPIEYIHANDMDFFSGNVVKYITRWRYKNGLEDLKKAKHYIELLMEQEYGYNG